MFKTRGQKAEEIAKKEPNYIPTKDLHEENEEENKKIEFPWSAAIILGVIALLIVACIIVIVVLDHH